MTTNKILPTGSAPLTVYKASAGSGKTFTLAVEYISLLIQNPKSYEQILAVTFTNKATEEMKMRIISQLYGIWKELPDSRMYLEEVRRKTNKPEKEIIRNAGTALSLLIHNYNQFRVQTIDAFFQSVLRNLARELELTANLRVDLNDRQVEEQAVDEMIESLDANAQVLSWIRDYIDKNIKDDLGWNVTGDIKRFGMNIFKDFYKKHATELDRLMKDERFFENYTKLLRERREGAKEQIKKDAEKILQRLDEYGLNDKDCFNYGENGTILKYLKLLAAGKYDNAPLSARVAACMEDATKWASKKSPRAADLTELAESELLPMVQSLEKKRLGMWKNYQSSVLTLRHLSQLRLLHAIADTVNDINKETNRFQLSNTQMLLHTLMKGSDSPFVFEKIGAQLKHIMIDEFQDTSRTQWDNFKVLMENCMAQEGSHNLIVGDVKQSIYRWRAGDWKLLNNIAAEFQPGMMQEQTLQVNYRSEQNIVDFNNAFFKHAVALTTQELQKDGIDGYPQLQKAYHEEELRQHPHRHDGKGLVRIELLPSSHYREAVMERLLSTIDQLIADGVNPKHIAILVRNNKDIQSIADLFMSSRPTLRLVSDEAFRLDASVAVNIILNALRLLIHPGDLLTKAKLVKAYNRHIVANGKTDTQLYVENDMDSMLPAGFLDFPALLTMPITDLVDRIYQLFSLHLLPDQSAYVCAFYDVLSNYLEDNIPDISHFIDQWEERLHEKTIQSDEIEGIRIISIHKSKGLEFDNVLIPLCDWALERGNTIWCEKKADDPFDKLPIVPVDYSRKSMMGTVYESDYKEEHLQNVVDNMNLLYVAFTRASKNLFVTGKRMSKDRLSKKQKEPTASNRSEIIEDSLPLLAEELSGCTLAGGDDPSEALTFNYGRLALRQESTAVAATGNVFASPSLPHRVQIETFDNPVEFRQSNKSKEFVSGEDEQPTHRLAYIKLGNVLHALFSGIRTLDDIEPKMRSLEIEGIIYDDDLTADALLEKIHAAMNNDTVREWFSPRWKLYNECTILTKDTASGQLLHYRPDRVMSDGTRTIVVDFKFGQPREEYKQQVEQYMQLLRSMGHSRVEGFLWYVLRNEIVAAGNPQHHPQP